MNNYRIRISPNDNEINIPINISFDDLGRNDLIERFEDEVIEQVINPIEDFEVTRYAHKEWVNDNNIETIINYKFYFFDRTKPIVETVWGDYDLWVNDYKFTEVPEYTGTSFSEGEIYYFTNSFKRSFFKLDFYDTPYSETQKLYLTVIIPTQQGNTRLSNTDPYASSGNVGSQGPVVVTDPEESDGTETGSFRGSARADGGTVDTTDDQYGSGQLGSGEESESAESSYVIAPPDVQIKRPDFRLDYTGDKEGFFIYWLKNKEELNIDEFYMSAKFFNAKVGQFIRMINRPQAQISKKYNFKQEKYFYYKTLLDYDNYEYEVIDIDSGNRKGTNYPINWYEYVNPE